MLMTNMGHIMTLANSIIGVGILAMPFCFYKCGIILSILLLVLNYLVTRVSCYYLIRSALLTRRRSFEYLGFYSFGSSGKLIVELCIIGYLIGTCIAYFVVVGDLGPRIIAKILDLDENDNLRTWVMIIVTVLCIIPLGLLRNVDSLSAVSTASIGFYICLVLKVISESQVHLMANDWYEKVVYWEPDGILQCLPIFSMACSCQMQLFEVMETVPNQSLEKMNSIVKQSTKICTSVYIMVGLFGYIGFCTLPFTGNILIHFSPSLSSEIIKIGFVLSIAFSFPLVIFPCRVSIYSLIYKRGHGDASTYIPERRFKTITISIVLISLMIALMIPSIELVIGLVGSTIGIVICVMFPASVYLKTFTKIRTYEKTVAQTVLIGGFCLMILGTYANLGAIDEKLSEISFEATQVPHIKFLDANLEQSIVDRIAKKDIEKNPAPPISYNVLPSDTIKVALLNSKLPFENPEINKVEKSKLPIETPKLTKQEKVVNEQKFKLTTENPKLPVEDLNLQSEKLKLPIESVNTISPNQRANESFVIQTQKDAKEQLSPNSLKGSIDSKIKQGELASDLKTVKLLTNTNNIIDKDAIKKDEEIAAEEAKDKNNKLEIAEEELKKTKEMLEKKVDELKQEIVKQNEETQKLVDKKLSDIIETVKEIKEEVKEEKKFDQSKIDEKVENNVISQKEKMEKLPEVNIQNKFNAAKESLVAQLSKKIQEPQNTNDVNISKITNLTNTKTINSEPMLMKELPNKKNTTEVKREVETLNIEPPKQKVYEPLSYKTGEILNKINEIQLNVSDNRVPIPLPLLINSTNNNQLIKKIETLSQVNNTIANDKSGDSRNITKIEVIKTNVLSNEIINSNNKIASEKPIELTEDNIEAIRRDILEFKESKTDNNEKLNREKRDLANFEYNIADNYHKIDNCLTNCFENEPLKNVNLIAEELNSGLKMMNGGRDLKSITEDHDEQ